MAALEAGTGTGPALALRAYAGKSRKAEGCHIVRWGKSLEWFRSVQFRSRAKANRILPREHTGHSRHCLPSTQEKPLHVDVTRWSGLEPDWLYLQPRMEKLYTVSKNKTRSWLWLGSCTPYCQLQTWMVAQEFGVDPVDSGVGGAPSPSPPVSELHALRPFPLSPQASGFLEATDKDNKSSLRQPPLPRPSPSPLSGGDASHPQGPPPLTLPLQIPLAASKLHKPTQTFLRWATQASSQLLRWRVCREGPLGSRPPCSSPTSPTSLLPPHPPPSSRDPLLPPQRLTKLSSRWDQGHLKITHFPRDFSSPSALRVGILWFNRETCHLTSWWCSSNHQIRGHRVYIQA